MKAFTISLLAFCPLVFAAAIEGLGARQEDLVECCYQWSSVCSPQNNLPHMPLPKSLDTDPNRLGILGHERRVSTLP